MVLELLKQLFGPKFRDAVSDPRSALEKSQDYIYGEDVLLGQGSKNKRITKLPFGPYNQWRTSACGAFAAAHLRRLMEGKTTFPPIWYRGRSNYSTPGMFLQDVLKMAALADEVNPPSSVPFKYNEDWANSLPPVELYQNRDKNSYEYVQIKAYDAESVFEAVGNGIPTIIGWFSTIAEWDEEMIPKDKVTLFTAPVRHFVVCLPNSVHTKDGYRWVSVVDSSQAKGLSLRHIREDFLKQRMYLGGGFYRKVTRRAKKVSEIPAASVEYGVRSSDVIKLQKFLYELGLVSKEHITGYYGNITAKAVLQWQLNNLKDANITQLNNWKGYYWGPASIKTAKNLYSK